MPRGRTDETNNKIAKEQKDKRKERELKKLSDFWSKVTGDIIGPRRRMRTYRTNEDLLTHARNEENPDDDIRERITIERSVPKIRISLRKQATIRIDNTGDLPKSALVSLDFKGTSDQPDCLDDNNHTGTNARARNIGEDVPKQNGKDDDSPDETTNTLPDTKLKTKTIPGHSANNADNISCSGTQTLTLRRKKPRNLFKDQDVCDVQTSYTHKHHLKPKWDTQLLCPDTNEECVTAQGSNMSTDSEQSKDEKVDSLKHCTGNFIVNQNNDSSHLFQPLNKSTSDDIDESNEHSSNSKYPNNMSKPISNTESIKEVEITPQKSDVTKVKLLTRSKTRTPEKFGLNKSRGDLLTSLPEPSPRKRKQIDWVILNDAFLAKHACSLWFSECRRQFQQRHPKANGHQLDGLMREAWDRLTPRHRLPYFVRAKSALEDRFQERKSKEERKKYVQGELKKECTFEHFLKLTDLEQEVTLKRGLYDLQKQLSPAHYELFLETVMMHSLATSTNRIGGVCLSKKLLYKIILAVQKDIICLQNEEHLLNKIYLQEKYHQKIENILKSVADPSQCYLQSAQDDPLRAQGTKQTDKWCGECNSECDQTWSEAYVALENDILKPSNSNTANLIMPNYCDCNQLVNNETSTSLTDDGILPFTSDLTNPGDLRCTSCRNDRQTQTPDCGLTSQKQANTGASGDFVTNDCRSSPTYKEILNYLKYGSAATGMLALRVSGEDWKMPNVENRCIYKDILLNAICNDLPSLGSEYVDTYFSSEEQS